MNLEAFEKRKYVERPTPIHRLDRLTHFLNGPEVWIKRDDTLGLLAGGNKTRKLEYLVADALTQGCDTLITGGGVQSNHCRLTASAAQVEGMACQLVLQESESSRYDPHATGNHLLDHLLGVEKVRVAAHDSVLAVQIERLADEAQSAGRKPYVIPVGGSNVVGTLGYVSCGLEILTQMKQEGVVFSHVICASGSGGTQAGLVTALSVYAREVKVMGINVSRDRRSQEAKVLKLAKATARRILDECHLEAVSIHCVDEYVGPGYALPSDDMVEAVKLVAQKEAILLDPVYTGKAMAGLIGLARKRFFTSRDRILFLHTGGGPALYAQTDEILDRL